MTTFAAANIPSNVNTVEELAAWAIGILAQINPTATVQTSPGQVEPVFTAQTFQYVSQVTDPERLVLVAYLPLDPGWRANGKLFHSGVKEVSSAAIPAAFTTN